MAYESVIALGLVLFAFAYLANTVMAVLRTLAIMKMKNVLCRPQSISKTIEQEIGQPPIAFRTTKKMGRPPKKSKEQIKAEQEAMQKQIRMQQLEAELEALKNGQQ